MTAKQRKLLSGGNPQVAKGYGEGPIEEFIDALPGWKQDIGRRIDTIVSRVVPDVEKAVKWNSPFYGKERDSWFLSFHAVTRYIKVTFFRGKSLDPVPPEKSKHENVRYFHIHESDDFEAQLAEWAKQASRLPGGKI